MKEELPEFHILVIDDDQDDHFFFINAVQNLRLSGFTKDIKINVSSAYNGAQGINFLLKEGVYKNSTEPVPDFIVLDLLMPVMDGFVVLNVIKAQPKLKNTPVFILTSSEGDNRERCLACGCAGFFSKPPGLDELKEVIIHMLNTSGRG